MHYYESLESLKKDQNILLLKHKGGKVVIMDKDIYHNKMLNLLSGREAYKLLISNPFSLIQNCN